MFNDPDIFGFVLFCLLFGGAFLIGLAVRFNIPAIFIEGQARWLRLVGYAAFVAFMITGNWSWLWVGVGNHMLSDPFELED